MITPALGNYMAQPRGRSKRKKPKRGKVVHPFMTYSVDTQSHTHGVRLFNSGNYALTADWAGDKIDCWDVSDPFNPAITDTIAVNGPCYVYIMPGDNYACTCGQGDSPETFNVIDISDPDNLALEGSCTVGSSYGQEIAFSGDYAYLAGRHSDTIYVIDISDPANPSVEDSISGAGSPNYLEQVSHLCINENTLFASSADVRISSFDISSAPTISLLNSLGTNLDTPHEIVYSGGYLFIANMYYLDENAGSLVVYDVSDPSNMAYETRVLMDGTNPGNAYYLHRLHGLWLDGTSLYGASSSYENEFDLTEPDRSSIWGCALTKFDITTPTAPIVEWSYRNVSYLWGAQQVTKHGNTLFVAAHALPGLSIWDERNFG